MQRALPAVRSTGSRTMFSSISVRQLRIAHLGRLFATAGNADVDVPEIGWLWQTPQGARATKAKLMKDRFTPKKTLGQNFVTDDGVLRDIVAASGVQRDDHILEVGPGTGNLTRHLLSTGARVTAIEKDDRLVERLKVDFATESRFTLIHGDVLRAGVEDVVSSMTAALQRERGGAAAAATEAAAAAAAPAGKGAQAQQQQQQQQQQQRIKLVANLPYNITKDFLKRILPLGEHISEVSIMIQEEVAQRLVDRKPGRPDYRAMNIFVTFFSDPKYRIKISKTKYFPEPGVDGALVTFKLLPPGARPSVPSTKAFLNLVARGFSARRKMVRNCLKPLYLPEQVVAALEACGLSPETRAQDLTVDQFAHLHWALHEQTTGKELGEEQSAALAAAEAAASEADLMMREGAAD